MSAETVLPPEGPAGPDKQPESRLLLDSSNDKCQDDANETSDTAKLSTKPFPIEHSADVVENLRGASLTEGDPVRSQPQPMVYLQLPSEEETNPLHNGAHIGLINGHGASCGSTQPVASSAFSPKTKKPPPPVSQRVQRKLRSSLSVNSDSSRRSKGSSTGSHKPGSSPEDCCVHCILACLFCEFLTLCNMVVAQASCGTCTSEACCCCCCTDDLGDDCNCPCDMDCGIMDACCESSDCLEICMECCGICFPT